MVEDLAIEGRRRKAERQRTERSQLGNRSQGVVDEVLEGVRKTEKRHGYSL